MKRVTKIETADGVLHDDLGAAQRHVEALYGNALSRLAHKLVRLEKYAAMMETLNANLPAFQELLDLKADLQLENPEEP